MRQGGEPKSSWIVAPGVNTDGSGASGESTALVGREATSQMITIVTTRIATAPSFSRVFTRSSTKNH